jgi:hypothetical protein
VAELLNAVLNLWFSEKAVSFLAGFVVISLSRNALYHVFSCLVRIWNKFWSWNPKMHHASGECH